MGTTNIRAGLSEGLCKGHPFRLDCKSLLPERTPSWLGIFQRIFQSGRELFGLIFVGHALATRARVRNMLEGNVSALTGLRHCVSERNHAPTLDFVSRDLLERPVQFLV